MCFNYYDASVKANLLKKHARDRVNALNIVEMHYTRGQLVDCDSFLDRGHHFV